MGTADVIASMAAGESVTTTQKRKVGKGKAAVELTVTRTEPTTVKVVDETVKEEEYSSRLPEDAGKRTVEVLPGLKLVCYSKGYVCLKVKGKGWNGGKVEVGKPLYREDIKALVEALFTEGQNAKSYEEANGTVPF